MLFQLTEDEGDASERPSDSPPIPSPPHLSEDQPQIQPDLSPRPSPTTHIPDSIPEGSGGNHGGQSSNDASLSGNEDGLTLQSVYDLCVSLCKQVTAQAKEIKALKAQVKKLKKGVKPLITHHKAWMKTRLARKTSLKKKGVHKEYVSKQGRKSVKSFKGEPSVHKDPAFDDLDDFVDVDDTLDYMESEDAQDEGRTSSVVLEEKENADKEVSTEAPVSTVKPNEGTDKKNKGTDKQDGSTDSTKVSTDRQGEGTADQNEGKSATQTAPTTTSTPTSTPTPTMFGDDETIAQVLITITPDEDKEVDYEILDKKYPIIEWRYEYLTTKPQYDETKEVEGVYLNVVIRSNIQRRYFSTLMSVALPYLIEMTYVLNIIPLQNWKIVSWKLHSSSGVHTIMTDEGLVIHMFVENKYPLKKEVLSKLIELKLETEEDSTMALELIRFVKKQIAELSIHLVVYNEELAILEETATGKGISNPLMAGSLPKTTKSTLLDVDIAVANEDGWLKMSKLSKIKIKICQSVVDNIPPRFQKSKLKKHEVKQVQQSCLGEDFGN
ncbi:hypothetical protein Tco_1270450 [Tanacetum coccineum]